jgi:hypothetical protein
VCEQLAARSLGGHRMFERRRNTSGRQPKSPLLVALAHHSLAQITRMAPHARRACARIASIESKPGTPVLSRIVKSDSLGFSKVFPLRPFDAIAAESCERRCSKDGSSPTAEISNA